MSPFQQNANGTYAGNMTGSGSLDKAGTGTLVLSGSNIFAGGTRLQRRRGLASRTTRRSARRPGRYRLAMRSRTAP